MWIDLLAAVIACCCCCRYAAAAERRIVAVGDLHGDLTQTLSVLRLTQIIDESQHWIAGNSILVQTGDILDVGPEDIEIVYLLMKLTKQARAVDGAVVQLLGNHELRNFRGDFSAANPVSLAKCGGPDGRNHILSMDHPLGAYLRTRDAIFHRGSYLFMHGGFSTSTVQMITDLKHVAEFNAELRRALVSGEIGPMARTALDLNETDDMVVSNPILVRSILNVKCNDLRKALADHFPGVQSVVVGHVPHDARDFEDWRLCGGALIDIDFGMSRWKDGSTGTVAALQIFESNQTAILVQDHVRLPNSWLVDTNEDDLGRSKFIVWMTGIGVVAFVVVAVAIGLCRYGRTAAVIPAGKSAAYGTFA